jgi:Methyltransferase domain/N-terminal domain of galactosyltransferase
MSVLTPQAPIASWVPKGLARYKSIHRGETIIVCGCGASLSQFKPATDQITIGVNDVGRLFDPTYLVVVNPAKQFTGDRFKHVAATKARALFTQLELGTVSAPVVRVQLGRQGGVDLTGDALPYTQNSPYVAVCLAAYMGAARIGLIGVDFTEHHFFATTGRHPLSGRLAQIDKEYSALAVALAQRGIELVNLSAHSRLASLRKVDMAWIDDVGTTSSVTAKSTSSGLRIVSYATTPVAGVPALLARCIDAATEHSAQCVWAGGSYGNGVVFAGGVSWGRKPREAIGMLEAADMVIVHNGKVDPAHASVLQGKPLVTMAHNYGWNVDMQHVRRGMPGLVVGQYQATLPEFAGWRVVPNPLPLWECDHRLATKSQRITIAYTPSGRHECYPTGHRLYWHGKGYDTTMRVLDRLARSASVQLETTAGGQVTHERALQMKQRAHIVIDECVTGSYHRNSLEGLAAGAVVVNGVGILPGVERVLADCAPGSERSPFVFSRLDTLEDVLQRLIEQGPEALASQGRAGREWMERHWRFDEQWNRCWEDLFNKTERSRATLAAVPARRKAPDDVRVSVIIPHSGAARLPHLRTSLRALSCLSEADDILVIEAGPEPLATALCANLGARHLYVADDGPFERGRLLNVGAANARRELVLWQDNDLFYDAGFIARASAELTRRRLDVLLPYHRLHYLAAADTTRIFEGSMSPEEGAPERTLLGGVDVCGGMSLLARDFFRREGGIPCGFKGWGGEDNAWAHKAALLGRYAVTDDDRQVAWHLHHADSGAQAGQPVRHAQYDANVALLARHRGAGTAAAYRRRFPVEAAERGVESVDAPRASLRTPTQPLRNVFACLVHESLECVVDLVRNLRHFDPLSRIVLYDGSEGGHLLDPRLPWAEWGVRKHPAPRPMKWGRLHLFALECFRLLRDGPDYDTLTIVDSDQLLLRPGYSEFLAQRVGPLAGLGVLSNRPGHEAHDTEIAPAKTAQSEIELWRPWLERFEHGVRQWVHWTFWPSAVVTRTAGEAIVDLFDRDAQLVQTLERSRLWATEEILFPTLAALLGFRVEQNPCDHRHVLFRQPLDPRRLGEALATPDAFWIHPVARQYGDQLRTAIRKSASEYHAAPVARQPAPSHPGANPWLPVLRVARDIKGWLDEDEAELLALTARDVLAHSGPKRLIEIGSFCGKATFVLASAVRLADSSAAGSRVVAVDTFDGTIGALDTCVERHGDTRLKFDAMLRSHGLHHFVEVRVGRAQVLAFNDEVHFLLVDGLHDFASVALDFHAVAHALADRAVVAFHDYASYFPGVCSFVDELIGGGQWREKARAGSLLVLERVATVPTAVARESSAEPMATEDWH